MTVLAANNASSTLASDITNLDLTITVAAGDGTKYPIPATADEYYYVTIEDTVPNREIVRVTGRTGDVLTVVRGQDGTIGQNFSAGAIVEMRWNKKAIQDIRDEATGYLVEDISSTMTITKDDNGKLFKFAGAAYTVNIDPFANFSANTRVYFKNTATGTIVLDPNGGETIEGSGTYSLAPGDEATLVKGTSEWGIFTRVETISRVLGRGYIDGLRLDNTARSGAELATLYSNVSFDTFTSLGTQITSAINTGADTARCYSDTFGTTILAGQTVRVTLTLTLTSGQAPSIAIVNSVNGNVSSYVTLVNGSNNIELTCWGDGTKLEFRNTNNANWSTSAISVTLQTLNQTEDIAVLAGVCRDATDAKNIELSAEILKQIDQPWAEGNSQGGMPSGVALSNNTWYHMFVISKADGTVDSGFDTALNASNLLADAASDGYLYYRRIGSVLTDGVSDIVPFLQIRDEFHFETKITETASIPTSVTALVLTVPVDVRVKPIVNVLLNAGGSAGDSIVYRLLSGDFGDEFIAQNQTCGSSGSAKIDTTGALVWTNTSAEVRHYRTGGSGTFYTLGWIDLRGKE